MTLYVNDGEGRQALHINQISRREEGWGVYDVEAGNCEVIINTGDLGDTADTLTVQLGTILADGLTVEVPETIVSVPVAQAEPRKDVIGATQDGSIIRIGGDQEPKVPEGRELRYAERPAPADITGDPIVPLAVVSVPADASAISITQVRDVRPTADYQVGTINGKDPDSFASSTANESITGTWTFSGGLKSDTAPSTANDVLRLNEASDFADATRVDNLETQVDGLSATDVGAVATTGGTFDGEVTFAGGINSGAYTSTGTGETGGLNLSDGVYYTVVNGVATIYSFSSEGGQGWVLSDPDGVGDAFAVDSSGNATAAGSFDAGGPVRSGGSALIDSIAVEDDGTTVGDATTLNLGEALSASVGSGVATINSELSAPTIFDSGSSVGNASEFDFADSLSASVTNGRAQISTAIPISDDGISTGTATALNFGENVDATVTDGTAEITAQSGGGGADSSISTIRAIDYGADPSGDTASTAALQDAINAAEPGDKVVWGEAGTYYLDGEISWSKRIKLDLHEGMIESDYHDELAYPDDQDEHYMPLFRCYGTDGTDHDISSYVNEGEDQVDVADTTPFEIGQPVILRTSSPHKSTMPGYGYQPTITRVREIQTGTIFLEDPALRDYSPSQGHILTEASMVERPVIKNIHVRPRREPYFDSDKGKVLGGPRHILGTVLTDRAKIENISAHHYDSHLWTSYDDRSPTIIDPEARDALNLSGSCGEPLFIISSNDVSIVRPKVKEVRRAIDTRAGVGTITVLEPDISGVSHIGLSWHSSADVNANITTIGGRVACKPTDPTMDNDDQTADKRYEIQSGYPFNPSVNGRFESYGTHYISRNSATVSGDVHIDGGSLHKYSTAATVLSIDGDDVSINGFELSSFGGVSELLEITGGTGISVTDVTLDASGGPADGVVINGGRNVTVDGQFVGAAGDRNVIIQGGTGVDVDLDIECDSNYAYLVTGGEDISIEGTLTGLCSNEQIQLDGGSTVNIDADLRASSGNARGVRIFGGASDVDITGRYIGTGIGVMFSGPADGCTVHDMKIEVTDGTRAAAVGSDGGATGIAGVRFVDNDMRGSVDSIVMNDAVSGFWAVNNVCSAVEYPTDTTVGQVAGNMLY